MTRKELLKRMDSKEISEWMVYYNLEPFGDYRADIRQAITSATIANANSKRTYKVEDFVPKFKNTKKEKMSNNEMKNILKMITKLNSGNK